MSTPTIEQRCLAQDHAYAVYTGRHRTDTNLLTADELGNLLIERDKLRHALVRVTGSLGLVINGARPQGVGHQENYNYAMQVIEATRRDEGDTRL